MGIWEAIEIHSIINEISEVIQKLNKRLIDINNALRVCTHEPKVVFRTLYELYRGETLHITKEIEELAAGKAFESYARAMAYVAQQSKRTIEEHHLHYKLEGGWIYLLNVSGFEPGAPRKEYSRFYRLYLNVNPEQIHIMVKTIFAIIKEYGSEYIDQIKFASAKNVQKDPLFLIRPETIVIYFRSDNSREYKHYLRNFIHKLKLIHFLMRNEIPKFTVKVGKGMGYASEPSEKAIELAEVRGYRREDMSFGGLMSMVIAEEYCGYIQRYKQFPDKSICNKLAKKIYRQLIARFEHTFEDPSLPIQ